jgi:hypothetical protein
MHSILTSGTGIVHEEYLLQQGAGRPVDHAVHGAQERGPRLVVEHDDHCRCGQAGQVLRLVLAPATKVIIVL